MFWQNLLNLVIKLVIGFTTNISIQSHNRRSNTVGYISLGNKWDSGLVKRENYLANWSVQVEFRYSEARQLLLRNMPHSLLQREQAAPAPLLRVSSAAAVLPEWAAHCKLMKTILSYFTEWTLSVLSLLHKKVKLFA